MLYKVYLSRLDGTYGNTPVGYVSLCYGHINIQNICAALSLSKIIPTHWFMLRELQIIEAPSINGLMSYSLSRRPPYRTMLVYLYPICPPNQQVSLKNKLMDYISYYPTTVNSAVTWLNNPFIIAE